MVTIPGYKGNANQNHSKIPNLTPVRIAIIKNTTNKKCWLGCGQKNPYTLLMGIQDSTTTLENIMEAP
jgi:hypothetical protein